MDEISSLHSYDNEINNPLKKRKCYTCYLFFVASLPQAYQLLFLFFSMQCFVSYIGSSVRTGYCEF